MQQKMRIYKCYQPNDALATTTSVLNVMVLKLPMIDSNIHYGMSFLICRTHVYHGTHILPCNEHY